MSSKRKGKNKKEERANNYSFLANACMSYGQLIVAANPLAALKYRGDEFGQVFLGFYLIYGPHIAIINDELFEHDMVLTDLSDNHQIQLLTTNRAMLAVETQKVLRYYQKK